MEEVEVKTETGNQKGKESQKEQPKSILDYDQGFRPEYRNRVKTVNVPGTVQEIPEDIVARNDEEFVQKAGEPEEQESVEKHEQKESEKQLPEEELQKLDFRFAMQTDAWNMVVKLLSTLVSAVRLRYNRESRSINARVVDPAHVAMYDISIPGDVLIDREAEDGITFVLDISTMPKFKDGSLLYMSRKNGEFRILNNGLEQAIKELDVYSVTVPRIPLINFDGMNSVNATVSTAQLRNFFDVAQHVSDAVSFTAHREGLITLSAKSDENKSEMVLDKDEHGGLIYMKMGYEVPTIKSSYPLEYILKVVKNITMVTDVDIKFKEDYPMAIEFKLPPAKKKNKGYYLPGVIPVTFLLAPRMDQ